MSAPRWLLCLLRCLVRPLRGLGGFAILVFLFHLHVGFWRRVEGEAVHVLRDLRAEKAEAPKIFLGIIKHSMWKLALNKHSYQT